MPDEGIIYTDGACRGNPGPGGWGVLLSFGDNQKSLCGAESETTNNRKELQAANVRLTAVRCKCRAALFPESEYMREGVLHYYVNWRRTHWKNAGRKPVKNRDLWEARDGLRNRHDIAWHWVKGHAGNAGNEQADQLANRAIDGMLSQGGLSQDRPAD